MHQQEKNSRDRILLVSILITIAVFYIFTTREGQLWGGDFAQYIQHAKNIVEKKPYSNTGYIFNPLLPYGSNAYPPIFPLLLAPIYKLFGLNLTIMKIEITFFFIGALIMIYLLFLQVGESKCSHIAIIALIGFNPYLWNFKENIVSDIPFMFFSFLCLYGLNVRPRVGIKAHPPHTMLHSLGGAGLLYLAFGTRILGVTLLLAFVIYAILKRISTFLIRVIIFWCILVATQQIIIRSFPTYHKEFSFTLKSIVPNIISYAKGLAIFFHNGYILVPTIIFSIYLIGVSVVGYIRRIKEKATLIEFWTPIYITMIIPWLPDTRYLIPIIPCFLFYVFSGIENSRVASVIVIAVTILSYIVNYTTMNYGRIDGVTNKECTELFNYIKEKTLPTDVFIFTRPRVLSLYTQRKSAVFPFDWEEGKKWQYLKEIKATYIIVGSDHFRIGKAKAFGIDKKFVLPFIVKYQDNFNLVYSNPGFEVYRIRS